MQKQQFSDVESRVEFMKGYAQYINAMAERTGTTGIDPARHERSIRKQHAKFYGEDSKYDGKGRLRTQPYSDLPKADQYEFGRTMSLKEVMYGVQ